MSISNIADARKVLFERHLKRAPSRRFLLPSAFFAAVFVSPALVLSSPRIIEGGTCGIYALFGMGLCAIFSYTGFPSLAQSAISIAAAYGTAVLTSRGILGPEVASLVAIVGVAALAFLIGVPLFFLEGFYFAMTTLLLGSIATVIVATLAAGATGGFNGMAVEPPVLFGLDIGNFHYRYYIVWALVLIGTLLLTNLERSKIVRRARAVKGDQRVAQLSGINPLWVKLQMFTLSSVFVSIAALLLVFSTRYLTPDTFDLSLTVTIFAGVIVGGRSNVWGAIAGAVFVVGVNDLLRGFETRATLVYGLVMAAVLLWSPGGLVDFPRLIEARRQPPDEEPRTLPAVQLSRASTAASSSDSSRAHEGSGRETGTDSVPLLEVSDVTVRFGQFTALRDVGLTLGAGRILAIMGPNGAGKTTLLNVITGYMRPTTGSVRLDGTEISGLPIQAIRRSGVSRTLQTPRVFEDMTVWENIALGADFTKQVGMPASLFGLPRSRKAERLIKDEAFALAELVGLGGYRYRLGGELSFGQRRLVEIARALGGASKVLLLDEPMAGLSSAMAEAVQLLIVNAANRGYGVILIEHNFDHVQSMAGHGIFIVGGVIAKEGSVSSLLEDPQVIEEYVGA